MILELFTYLSTMLYGSAAAAITASLVWGVLSIVLSPCHLASIPLIVGFIDEQKSITTKRAFLLSTFFAAGILTTISLIGVVTAVAGRMLGDIGQAGNIGVALVFFVFGLHLLDVVPLPFLQNAAAPGMKRRGVLAAFVLGFIFGIALGPCTFAFMAPMLGVAFNVASANPLYSAALVVAYAVGHGAVIILAGTFTEYLQKYLNWNERSKGTVIIKKICGVLVIAGGIYLLYSAV